MSAFKGHSSSSGNASDEDRFRDVNCETRLMLLALDEMLFLDFGDARDRMLGVLAKDTVCDLTVAPDGFRTRFSASCTLAVVTSVSDSSCVAARIHSLSSAVPGSSILDSISSPEGSFRFMVTSRLALFLMGPCA